MKKALITGGAGFVGSHLGDEFLQRGHIAAVGVGQDMYQIAGYAEGSGRSTAVLLDALME
jgi:nucleoside-diphosphate-sugar epimerase